MAASHTNNLGPSYTKLTQLALFHLHGFFREGGFQATQRNHTLITSIIKY